MEYTLTVQQSSPKAILGMLNYYDTTYGVVLAREDDGKAAFSIFTSANGSIGDDFRMEIDASGQITEFVMRDGDKQDIKKPHLLSKVEAHTISQTDFLMFVADVLSVL